MKKENALKSKILSGSNHPLLNLKEVMDQIIKEAEDLPAEVRQTLIQARDTTWKAFVEGQERINSSVQ
jgi:hypothetical protein